MKLAYRLPRRRDAFTLIELLVVMILILVLAALGLGYIVFGQDNQHSFNGAQALTGALLNAKQRARRDGLPTGVRILFNTSGLTPPAGPVPSQAGQLQLIQQPEDYNAGQWINVDATKTILNFNNAADFQGGAQYIGQIDESTVQVGDYFVVPGTTTPHRINTVFFDAANGNAPSLQLDSPVSGAPTGQYTIIRAPRRLPSEDAVQMPSGQVIDNATPPGSPSSTYCQNIPARFLKDSMTPAGSPGSPVAEIVFAPSGAVIGQGTTADKIYLWLRDSNPKLTPIAGMPPGAPLILSVQIRTGLIGVYPVAPCSVSSPFGAGNDPYAYVRSPRSSGL